jgi:hypothetical protein
LRHGSVVVIFAFDIDGVIHRFVKGWSDVVPMHELGSDFAVCMQVYSYSCMKNMYCLRMFEQMFKTMSVPGEFELTGEWNRFHTEEIQNLQTRSKSS